MAGAICDSFPRYGSTKSYKAVDKTGIFLCWIEKGCERKEYAGKIATERECHRLKAFPAGTGGKCVRELVRRSATSGWEKGAESGTDGARYAHKEGRISEKF